MKITLNSIIKGFAASVVGVSMLFTANSAFAAFPENDITLIVPYSPGGGSDQMARRLNQV